MLTRKLNKPVFVLLILLIVIIRAKADYSPATDKKKLNFAFSTPEIPLHSSLEIFMADYHEKNAELFEKLKQKNNYCFKTIDKIFLQHGLPIELKYIAVVESKLKNTAVSQTGAVGLWQFMPATAKTMGLKISASDDERKNTWKSSVAAARYLEKLYSMFQDWLLVIAAYNSGPGTVYNAIKKSGSRNFWQLQYFLPKETRMHVKKFIATHYYFENKGSWVTLGRQESEKYKKSLEELIQTNIDKDSKDNPLFYQESEFPSSSNWTSVSVVENKIIFHAKK